MIRPLLVSILLLFTVATSAIAAEKNARVDFTAVAKQIEAEATVALNAYDPASGDDTAEIFSDLYFEVFEGSGMEMAVGLADPDRKTDLESLFAQIIGKANGGVPKAELTAAWEKLNTALKATATDQVAADDQGDGFWAAAIQSFLILIREGFEAMLVVTALVAYLKRSGNEARVRHIWQGVIVALVASIATAWLLTAVIKVSGEGKEALEGVTMLIASVVLFYVSYWLFAKSEADRWQAYVRGKIDRAVEGNKVFTLAFAAFLAVYREGAETVLFYQALLAGSNGQETAILGGFVVAFVALIALYWVMRSASLKLPMGLFFTATAILLYYLSVLFAGKGILELQEAQWISITPVDGVPSISWLGLFPTVESLSAQALLLAPLPVAWWWWARKRRQNRVGAGAAAQ
jgi:high-affinity iron transporter